MHELPQNDYREVKGLYEGYLNYSMLYSNIEGNRVGRVFVDHQESPQAVFVWSNSESTHVTGRDDNQVFQQALRKSVLEGVVPSLKLLDGEFLSLFSFPETYPAKM